MQCFFSFELGQNFSEIAVKLMADRCASLSYRDLQEIYQTSSETTIFSER